MARNKYQKKVAAILCVIAVVFTLVGCKKETPTQDSEDETTISLNKETPAATSEDETTANLNEGLIIELGVGVGPVRFGMSKEEVIKHFGPTDKIREEQGVISLDYISSRGLLFGLEPTAGINYIKCYSKAYPNYSHVTTFAERTTKDVAMGASRDQIAAAYGEPDRTRSKEPFTILYYDDLRSEMIIANDRLVGIKMVGNEPAFGEETVDISTRQLLERFKQSLSWQESVAMKINIKSEVVVDGERIPAISERVFTFRRDNERAEWLGKKLEVDENGKVDLDNCHVIKTIMDGNAFARLTGGLDRPPIGAFINRDEEFYSRFLSRLLRHPMNGGPLWGRIYGSGNKSVADLLSGAASLSMRENLEEVNGTVCYVVEAKTKYGRVTAWIAPEKGYNALRWSIHKASNDLFGEAPISERWEGMRVNSWLAEFVADDLQKVGDFWVTKVGRMTISIGYNDDSPIKTRITKHKYKVSDIQIDPDFEALEAFKIDFPDGTPVQIEQAPGVRYIWSKDKKFIVDERNGSVMHVPKDWQLCVRMGKALPELRELKLDLKTEQIKDKRILVCFFELNQRPSRNCMMQLTRDLEELKQKNVAVAAVQSSKVDENALNQLIKNNNIPFPVGMVQNDVEKTRFVWGVKSLPWLILTDKKHIVQAEGFNINELDEKITTLRKK